MRFWLAALLALTAAAPAAAAKRVRPPGSTPSARPLPAAARPLPQLPQAAALSQGPALPAEPVPQAPAAAQQLQAAAAAEPEKAALSFDGGGETEEAESPVAFAREFVDSIREASERRGARGWGKSDWDRLRHETRQFLVRAGRGDAGEDGLAKRGEARRMGVRKFKWEDRRVFFSYDERRGVVTFLDMRFKAQLFNKNEEEFYEELAARLLELDEHLADGKGERRMNERLGPVSPRRD